MTLRCLAHRVRVRLGDQVDPRDVFVLMLAQPDPPDMPPREHAWIQAGDPDRMQTQMPGILLRWLQRRLLAPLDGDVGPVVKTAKPVEAVKPKRRRHRPAKPVLVSRIA